MRALLDTHAFLWLATDDPRLGPARDELLRAEALLLSAVVPWELAIKTGDRLRLATSVEELVRRGASSLRLEHLPISWRDAVAVADLPRHHRDPFDRLLVAQARRHGLVLATADRQLAAYDVELLTLG